MGVKVLIVGVERVLEYERGWVVDLESEDCLIGPREPLMEYLTRWPNVGKVQVGRPTKGRRRMRGYRGGLEVPGDDGHDIHHVT